MAKVFSKRGGAGPYVGLISVVVLLFAVAAAWSWVAAPARSTGGALQVAAELAPFVIIFGAVALAARAEGRGFLAAVGFTTAHPARQLLTAGVLLAATLSVTLALAAFGFHMFGGSETGFLAFLYATVRSFLLAGVGEELIWRGYVLGKLRVILRSDTGAVLLSSALFGLWHYPGGQDLLQVGMTMLFGVLWATARVKIRYCSTLATGTAHGLHDVALLILAGYAA